MPQPMELVCPAGSLPALRAAIDNGADTVYLGFRGATDARNFPGLGFDQKPPNVASPMPMLRASRCSWH